MYLLAGWASFAMYVGLKFKAKRKIEVGYEKKRRERRWACKGASL